MSQPIICLDFDGVIHSYTSGWKGARTIPDPPVEGAIPFIARLLEAGYNVAIYSTRSNHLGGVRAMRTWLKHHAGSMWYDDPAGGYGLERVQFSRQKPPALLTIDDRAITFTGTWPSLETIRAFVPWNKSRKEV